MKKQKFPKPEIDSWIASKDNGATDEDSLFLINNRDSLEVIYENDDSYSYEYDIQAIVRFQEKYFYLTTGGCSCSDGPEYTWLLDFGPSSLKELIAWLEKGYDKEKKAIEELKKLGLIKDKQNKKETIKLKVIVTSEIEIDKSKLDGDLGEYLLKLLGTQKFKQKCEIESCIIK